VDDNDDTAERVGNESRCEKTGAAGAPTHSVSPRPAAQAPEVQPNSVPTADNAPMYQRVGELTRMLHDALRELGLDTKLEAAAHSLPDARDRLSYIATLTGQAADRVLSAVERGQADQTALNQAASRLAAQWLAHAADSLSTQESAELIRATRALLVEMPERTAATKAQFHEIMMAQDFHDLTGQVIVRIADLVRTLETNLVALLVETRSSGTRDESTRLAGPVIHPSAETAANQAEVDGLLESLGF
jgi:chemotaxis protein CheZ